MPKRDKLSELPPAITRQLYERLIASNFGDYAAHSEWLAEQGYSVSKSAIHRHAQENAAEIRGAVATGEMAHSEFRMRCLEVVASLGAADNDDLVRRAESLLVWVTGR